MPSRAISAHTTEAPNSTSDMILNVGSTTRRANVGQIVGGIFTSQGQMAYAASSKNSTFLNPPTSGAILSYSSGSSAPSWMIPTSGAILAASSLGVPTWIALGTSGQVLQSTGGIPTWAAAGGGGGTTEVWEITKGGTSQAFTSGSFQSISFLAELRDSDAVHSTDPNSTLVTVPTSGSYIIGGHAKADGVALDGAMFIRIFENNSTQIAVSGGTKGAGVLYSALNVSAIRYFATSGATLQLQLYSNSTFNLSVEETTRLTASFWGHRLV